MTLALALLAQRGNVSAMPRENGGQPGQKQWAFDNMRKRPDYDMLYPCCGDASPDARAPSFVDAMRTSTRKAATSLASSRSPTTTTRTSSAA